MESSQVRYPKHKEKMNNNFLDLEMYSQISGPSAVVYQINLQK